MSPNTMIRPSAPKATTTAVQGKPAQPALTRPSIAQTVVNTIDTLFAAITRAVGLLAQQQDIYCPGMSQEVEVHRVIGTVDLIRKLLEFNTDNRPKNLGTVKSYKLKMLEGKWAWDLPVVVMLDTNGKVHNGQHVMSALLDAEKERGTSVTYKEICLGMGFSDQLCLPNMLIVTGLKPETADHIDTGRPRKQSDIVYRKLKPFLQENDRKKGEQTALSNLITTVAKFIWLRVAYGMKQRGSMKFGHEDLVPFIEQHANPDNGHNLAKSVEYVFDEDKTGKKAEGVIPLSKKCSLNQLGVVHYLMTQMADEDIEGGSDASIGKADAFIKELSNGKVLPKPTTIVQVLLCWLEKHRAGSTGAMSNVQLEAQMDALIVAAKAYAGGAKIDPAKFMAELTVPAKMPAKFNIAQEGQEEQLVDQLNRGDDVLGYKVGKVYKFPNENGEWTDYSEKQVKDAGWKITPVLEATYPHLGGLDVPPVMWDETIESEVQADEGTPVEAGEPTDEESVEA